MSTRKLKFQSSHDYMYRNGILQHVSMVKEFNKIYWYFEHNTTPHRLKYIKRD